MNLDVFENGLNALFEKKLSTADVLQGSLNDESFSPECHAFRHCLLADADSVEDFIRSYRVAVKLGLFCKQDHRWGPDQRLGAGTHISELALTLLAAEQNLTTIKAGLLYASVDELSNDVPATISRLFQQDVPAREGGILTSDMLTLIQDLDAAMQDVRVLEQSTPEVVALHCSIVALRIAQGLPIQGDAVTAFGEEGALLHLAALYQSKGVPDSLRVQFLLEAPSVPLDQYVADVDLGVSNQVLRMRNALRFAGFLFSGIERDWGPDERLPLIWHAAEVGFLPMLSGVHPEVVIAAICHDMLECYVDFVKPEYIEEKLQFFFGERVASLVKGVTEPPKLKDETGRESLENWTHRKESVLRNILAGDVELATLSCATKISTLAAGNKMLAAGRSFSAWSSGPVEDNLTMFAKYAEAYAFSGISPVLLELYHREISRMIRLLEESGEL